MSSEPAYDVRAGRLLRWYPRAWRDRYGDEFLALLGEEIDEQPRSWRREVDVRWHGVRARLAVAGLGELPVRDRNAMRIAQTVSLSCVLGCLISLWSQILRGGGSAESYGPSVTSMRIVLLVTFAAIGLRAVAASRTVATRLRRATADGKARALGPPLLSIGIGATLFSAGFAAVWLPQHSAITPAGITTTATESISTYWLHPGLLSEVPGAQIAWMVISPLALALVVAGSIGLRRVLDDEALTGRPAAASIPVVLLPALLTSAWWVVSSQHFQRSNLRAGTLDVVMIALMAGLLVVLSMLRRARLA